MNTKMNNAFDLKSSKPNAVVIPMVPGEEIVPVEAANEAVAPEAQPAEEKAPEIKLHDFFHEINILDVDVSIDLECTFYTKLMKNTKRLPIIGYINTYGGDARACQVIIDQLRIESVPIVFIAGSNVSSAGTVIYNAPGALRLAYPSSRFLYHYGHRTYRGFHPDEIEAAGASIAKLDKWIVEYYADAIGIPTKDVKKKLFNVDRFYTANEMLHMGTKGGVDGIILKHLGEFVYEIETRDGIKTVDLKAAKFDDLKVKPAEGEVAEVAETPAAE